MRRIFLVMVTLLGLSSPAIASSLLLLKDHIATAEKKGGIPENLILALAMVESSLKPWAVYANQSSRFFSSKEEAVYYIKQLQTKGFTNINVGCMQINLRDHRHQFKSVADSIDPIQNIAFAIRLLNQLKKRYGSWELAVRYYHCADQQRGAAYQRKIYTVWRRLPHHTQKTSKNQKKLDHISRKASHPSVSRLEDEISLAFLQQPFQRLSSRSNLRKYNRIHIPEPRPRI